MSKDLRVNQEIRAKEVRLIGPEGDQIGIMPVREALQVAADKGLDLVEVAPQARPPVCRIMDYGKYKYQQSKKEREARKRQRTINVKEVKFRLNIEEHDFQTKARNAEKFLKKGDKVKVTIMFRGREITHATLGKELCMKLAEQLKEVGVIEKQPKVEGRNMVMILAPKDGK
ncbi:MAG: translation initiation factor IF-3 [Thermoanaerobacteraceae bacterium]|nr:translation initiation factor IF-3 [Thermoanaerobacteraceae bacterium]